MSKQTTKGFTYIILIALSIIFLLPFYVLFVTSFKSFNEVSFLTMWKLPTNFDLSSFKLALDKLYPNFLNSVKMAIPATLLSCLLGSINGYALSKYKFKGSNLIFTLILLGMFIPFQSIIIPLIRAVETVNLYNTITGLVLVHVIYGIPITTLMFRNFYVSIPQSMIESAQVDGAGFFRIYFSMIVPLSVTGFIVVMIWQFTNIWNEFLFAIVITGHSQHPIMVALQNLSGSQIVEWNVQMAGAILAAIPTLIVYIIAGKYFIRGLLAGSVKG